MSLYSSSGFLLPSLGFTTSSQANKTVASENSFFIKCRIQLNSNQQNIGQKRDKNGSVTIFSNPPRIKFTIKKYEYSIKLNDGMFKLDKTSSKTIVLKDSHKTSVKLTFNEYTECLSFISSLFLLTRKANESFYDMIIGEGHPIDHNKDDFKVIVTKWNLRNETSLSELIFEQKELEKNDLSVFEKELLDGGKKGGLRCAISLKNVYAFDIVEVIEFKQRVRIPVIYSKYLELENICDELQKRAESAVKRQRIVQSTKVMKKRLDELNAQICENSIIIEQLKEEKLEMEKKLNETQKAKQRVDNDENKNQLELMKTNNNLKGNFNSTIENYENLELDLISHKGESELFAKCILNTFAIMCSAMGEKLVPKDISESIENSRRQITEVIYL